MHLPGICQQPSLQIMNLQAVCQQPSPQISFTKSNENQINKSFQSFYISAFFPNYWSLQQYFIAFSLPDFNANLSIIVSDTCRLYKTLRPAGYQCLYWFSPTEQSFFAAFGRLYDWPVSIWWQTKRNLQAMLHFKWWNYSLWQNALLSVMSCNYGANMTPVTFLTSVYSLAFPLLLFASVHNHQKFTNARFKKKEKWTNKWSNLWITWW